MTSQGHRTSDRFTKERQQNPLKDKNPEHPRPLQNVTNRCLLDRILILWRHQLPHTIGCVYIYIYTHIYIHTHTHKYIYIYIHIYIYLTLQRHVCQLHITVSVSNGPKVRMNISAMED